MAVHTIKKGLNLPITGDPQQVIHDAKQPSRVALVAADYIGMKPRMEVKVGDAVKRGQVLFEDRKTPGVLFTAPGAGTVVAINRGEKRALLSLVIELSANEQAGTIGEGDEVKYAAFTGKEPGELGAAEIKALLLESGSWTAIRTRPFAKVADPSTEPKALFVTATDSNPLAPSPDEILEGNEADFHRGLAAVAKLAPKTYLCVGARSKINAGNVQGVRLEAFEGLHPYGNVGTHIHLLDPVERGKNVWYIGFQEVIAIGRLFKSGLLDPSRVVSLAGPVTKSPRLLRTRVGAHLDDLIRGELADGDNRVISGSVFGGRKAMGEIHGYLGRYHQQISCLREGTEREFLGWLGLGTDKFSVIGIYLGKLLRRRFPFTTTTHGSHRAMVPLGLYEKVMPLDIMPTFLLRALAVNDTDNAIKLGALELDEEDLALCSFVDPGKENWGYKLRQNLTVIEKEGA
ncbi:MAG: Na(+)-translocating NADH-quinone reductase subunit A [Myxococcales bacterium]|nr:Na(+)-translocating NADH-quinone reductase subunit A [Myxococcales bacterium]MCB9702595.1 Na(+)-translocating NADH-quinone reductase subunit A [Myxococcales bacterium]